MKQVLCVLLLMACSVVDVFSQQAGMATAGAPAAVPALINFSGALADPDGKPQKGVAGVTFLLYRDSQGGAPLWMETQNVHPDKAGHYTVVLGSTTGRGLPSDLFVSGEARWLAVQAAGQAEQPRVLLVAVPYALKAGDAETIRGLPPSAFVLAAPNGTASGAANGLTASSAELSPASSSVTTTGGTVSTLPLFTTATNIQDSAVTQTGSGTTAKIGVNNAAPTAVLDVKGSETVRGIFTLAAGGKATAAAGKNSQPLNFTASVFNSSTASAVNGNFRWQAEPAANNTSTPSGTLNLLYGLDTAAPAETGLKIANSGILTFAAGQTFPGTGKGTVTSIATGLGLKGGPITGAGTLTIDSAVVPQLNVANIFTTSQSVTGNFSASSDIIAGNALAAASMSVNGSTIGVSARGSEYGGIFSTTTGGTGLYSYNSNDCNYCVGVEGYAFGATELNFGVFGSTSGTYGVGVYGQAIGQSIIGSTLIAAAGVWGDGGKYGIGIGATADDERALSATNNSAIEPTIFAYETNPDGYSFEATGAGHGYCHIDTYGNLGCTGVVAGVVPLDAGARKVQVYAVEAPQHWFEDAGSGQLSGGRATVTLEPMFGQTVNTGIEYHVFLTPKGDCEGLYVSNETPQGFEVHELRGGHSSVDFDYRIMATRKGYENIRLAEERPIAPPKIPRRAPVTVPAHAKPFVPGRVSLMRPAANLAPARTDK